MSYDRKKAIAYARKWALLRNPAYYNFDGVGGDCTNFVSQCLFAGCGVMNYKRDTGWYYKSSKDRAAAWAGVEFLHRFLTANAGPGPYGRELPLGRVQAGDVIQMSYDGAKFGHSVIVVDIWPEIMVAQHSDENFDNRPLREYVYQKVRLIHIEGSRG